jgi:asparagine synthase (glutamine-hydrolysing)
VRRLLALIGWNTGEVPVGAWSGADAAGRWLTLTHLPVRAGRSGPEVATNEDRSVRVVLAGQLANGRELRQSLAERHAFHGRDDAEVVAHLYEERGTQEVRTLRGAFAFVLWDAPRRRVVLARDHLGLETLYYLADRTRLAAASTLGQLLALPDLPPARDLTALDAFLTLGTVPAPATLHPAIRQVRPGEIVVWEDGRLRSERYWHLVFPERRLRPAALPPLVRQQLGDALRRRQAGAVTGLLLSGGLDAAALLALAVEAGRPPARAYTVAMPGGDDEELRVAAEVAARAGVEHVVVREEPDWPGAADALLALHGGPAGGVETPVVQLAAARAGADLGVALAGIGGEEVLGGSAVARHVERLRRYRRLPALVREAVEMWARIAPARLVESVRHLVSDERLAPLALYARRASLFAPEGRATLYTPETLAALVDTHPWAPLSEVFADAVASGAADAADAIHAAELALRLPARAAVVGAVAASVELRLPLADHRLAQLAASAPAAARGGVRDRQLLLRHAVATLLPDRVLTRAHAGPLPPGRWKTGSLRDLVEETLAPARVAALGVFRPETIDRLRREHLAGRRDQAARLWAVVLATRWLERGTWPVGRVLHATG